MEKKQLTPEELQEIKDMQVSYNKLVFEIGSIDVQLFTLDKEKENLQKLVIDINNKEKEMINKLQEKYGEGTINIDTGEISPTK